MDTALLTALMQQALIVVALMSAPAVICAGTLGLVVGILQAVTQIQDQSIGQTLKIMLVIVVLVLTQAWMAKQIVVFAEQQFRSIPAIAKGKRG